MPKLVYIYIYIHTHTCDLAKSVQDNDLMTANDSSVLSGYIAINCHNYVMDGHWTDQLQ